MHPRYAESLSEFGRPRFLRASGGWILERGIPGTDARDAMTCYPLFSCQDWSRLAEDLEEIGGDLISLVLVTDPFGNYSEALLQNTFKDLVTRFKEHFVADLREGASSFVSRHHQYYAHKALEKVRIEFCEEPRQMTETWSALYAGLVARHELTGIKAFSQAAFAKQLSVPGIVMLRSTHEGETVGAHLWYMQGDVALSHLTASSPRGYEVMAAYALSWTALEFFSGKMRWIDWGAGAGLNPKASDGLTRFKRGWSNTTRPAYLCGRIFDQTKYEELASRNQSSGSNYFPAYRAGELC